MQDDKLHIIFKCNGNLDLNLLKRTTNIYDMYSHVPFIESTT